MKKPYKYTIVYDITRHIQETNTEPLIHELQTWQPTNNPNVMELRQTKTVWIDTRYEAKLRLYNYVNYIRKGLEVPIYNPFYGTEIGKTIPILNF